MSVESASSPTSRELRWPGFIAVVVVWLVIIQGVGLAIGADKGDDKSQFPTAEYVLQVALIPIGLSILFSAGVVTWLGWWREIWRPAPRPAQAWVRRVPIVMVIAALIALDYGRFADQSASLIVALLVLGVFVGVGEELMFRGIGVNVFRRAGLPEGKVALWSSVIFGLAHVTNAIGAGPQAIAQAAIVSFSGYFFYLAYRSFGVLLVPMFVHGLWDFSLFTSQAGPTDPKVYLGSALIILLQIALIVLVIKRRHRVDPATDAAAPAIA